MPSLPALEFNNVSKQYRGFFRSQWVTALRDFSLRVETGEIFGFLGPNGAGKTTAMHLAIGLMFPSSGRGEMLGHQFGHAPTRPSLDDADSIRVGVGTTVGQAEKLLILKTLESTNNNKTRAADILGISLKTLHNKLKEYGTSASEANRTEREESEELRDS